MTFVPPVFGAASTLTASYYKILSPDPLLGFFSQAARFREAYNNGELLPPTTSPDQMYSIVQSSTIPGIATVIFALAIIVMLADCLRVWYGLIFGEKEPDLHEAPYEPSEIAVRPGTVTAITGDRDGS